MASTDQAVERFLEFMEAGDVTEIVTCFTDVCRKVVAVVVSVPLLV